MCYDKPYNSKPHKILAMCACGKHTVLAQRAYNDSVKKYGSYKCLKCIIKARGSLCGEGIRNKVRRENGVLNNDIIAVICDECGSSIRIQHQTFKQWVKRHAESDYICAACMNKLQDRSKSKSDEHRKECSDRSKEYWKNPEYRDKLLKHLAEIRSLGPGPSSLEKAVWKLLDDMGVKFACARDGKSYTIGKWSIDIMVPSTQRIGSNKNILIEVDGYYRHSRNDVVGYDRAKENFAKSYHSNDNDFERILEHEFLAPGKMRNRIETMLGRIQQKCEIIDLDNLIVKPIDFETAASFMGAYHYLGYAQKRGYPIGCYHGDDLIGVALFAGLTRDQSAKRLLLKQYECRELIRFCLSPFHRNDNLGSWFMSRALKELVNYDDRIKVVVSFSDPIVGHTGGLYKACNYDYDGQCRESYAYVGENGFVMHKKTMWDWAAKNRSTEEEMSKIHGYRKIDCDPKHRYLYWFDDKDRQRYISTSRGDM